MPERKFNLFDDVTAELMRAAYHDACEAMQKCTGDERAAIVAHIIDLVQSGERNRQTLAQQALLRMQQQS